jgi:hypothetical protein
MGTILGPGGATLVALCRRLRVFRQQFRKTTSWLSENSTTAADTHPTGSISIRPHYGAHLLYSKLNPGFRHLGTSRALLSKSTSWLSENSTTAADTHPTGSIRPRYGAHLLYSKLNPGFRHLGTSRALLSKSTSWLSENGVVQFPGKGVVQFPGKCVVQFPGVGFVQFPGVGFVQFPGVGFVSYAGLDLRFLISHS